ncbi:MAG: tRNA (adenosine(37)-N6)-dimethylallyltransferase MiaA [Candidatus Saccharimonadales bacterium]
MVKQSPASSFHIPSSKPPLVVLVGETASGKSALALELAEKFGGEIICADSWTVYRDFNIGTAKPSASDCKRVPHHLLDIADPALGFSAPQFQKLALAAIEDIASRGKLAIMVGGTGLYIDSVIFDYGFLPAPNAGERARLNRLTLAELVKITNKLSCLSLATIDASNKRRVIRLIENNGQLPTKSSLRQNTLLLGLNLPREQLAARITNRVDAMLANGLEQEVKQLAEIYSWQTEPMKGIGYREWRDYFNGQTSLEQTRQKIIKSSLGLAKKQRTWFKRPVYQDLVASDLPFLAKSSSGSIDAQSSAPQSPAHNLTQKSSSQKLPAHGKSAARNKSIQWLNNNSKAVEIITAFLNK